MKSKPIYGEIGFLEGIYEGTDRVENATECNQGEDQQPAGLIEVWKIDEGGPAEGEIDRNVEPLRGFQPEDSKYPREQCPAPNYREKYYCLLLFQQIDRKWSVGACDKKWDIGVVDPAPNGFSGGAPRNAMIDSATRKE